MTRANDRAVDFDKRFAEFARHKEELIVMLRKPYERNGKAQSFNEEKAWSRLKGAAHVYLYHEVDIEDRRSAVPASKRVEKLVQLGNALRGARQTSDEVMPVVRCHLVDEWCEANGYGNPDFSDQYDAAFDDLVAGLTALEEAAFRAAKYVRRKRRGPLGGTSILPHRVIIQLEHTYRDITKQEAGAGRGPFANFVMKFLNALGRCLEMDSVVRLSKSQKSAKKVIRRRANGDAHC
jgi:hypothetical protein